MKILQGNLGRLQIQTTDYTCAPTSFLNITIATLNTGIILNDAGIVVNMDELSFAQALGCTGREGTTLKSMSEFAINTLGAVDSGECTWDFKTACVAVITENRLSHGMRTHAVTVFGVFDEKIVWYCPFFGELNFSSKEDFLEIWHSENSEYKQFSFNFRESLIDFIISE